MLDLLYGPIAWGAACELRERSQGSGRTMDETVLYVNAGGHEGLGTLLRRYERAGLLRKGESAEAALEEALAATGVELPEDPFRW